LSPALRTRRLLALTLRDLRRLTTGPIPRTANEWEARLYGRLSALPEQAEPLQRAQLLAALSVGTEIIRLRRFALHAELDAALDALARGDSSVATERLARYDKRLAALPSTRPGARVRLRARGSILAMLEALAQHPAYFDSGARR
jgi:fusaric acid resistance family protein